MSLLTISSSLRRACTPSSSLHRTALAAVAPARTRPLSASSRLSPPFTDLRRSRNTAIAGYASSSRHAMTTYAPALAPALTSTPQLAGVLAPPRPRPPRPSLALATANASRGIAITATAPAMYSHPPPAPGHDFNVMMVGAGNIMFGSDEGPWNHSFRFEHKLGPRLKVVALIDPSAARAEAVLAGKRASFVESAYKDTRVYPTVEAFRADMKPEEEPQAIVVGSPPKFRGGTQKPRDLEMTLLELFPNSAYFIEKPVAAGPADEAHSVTKALIDAGNIVSVGYMLRYLRCVQKMKQIIHENNLTVMGTVARYACAYEAIAKPAWWDKRVDMGPVIEQATHFCDLSRYFGGDVDINSVVAHSVEWYEKPGELSRIPVDESVIPEEERIPRMTSATWKYQNGAVGSLVHAVALQGTAYSCELEVYCDGYQMRLVDPYNAPVLYLRRPGDDHEERHAFQDDDPFFSEVSNFIDCIEGGPDPHVLSSFEDATKTYEFTWAIRRATEASQKRHVKN